jgi:hypothetical protein
MCVSYLQLHSEIFGMVRRYTALLSYSRVLSFRTIRIRGTAGNSIPTGTARNFAQHHESKKEERRPE